MAIRASGLAVPSMVSAEMVQTFVEQAIATRAIAPLTTEDLRSTESAAHSLLVTRHAPEPNSVHAAVLVATAEVQAITVLDQIVTRVLVHDIVRRGVNR